MAKRENEFICIFVLQNTMDSFIFASKWGLFRSTIRLSESDEKRGKIWKTLGTSYYAVFSQRVCWRAKKCYGNSKNLQTHCEVGELLKESNNDESFAPIYSVKLFSRWLKLKLKSIKIELGGKYSMRMKNYSIWCDMNAKSQLLKNQMRHRICIVVVKKLNSFNNGHNT